MHKGNIFFVIKKYLNADYYNEFTISEEDIELERVNCVQDLEQSYIPIYLDFTPIEIDKCNWYLAHNGTILEKGKITQQQVLLRMELENKKPRTQQNSKKIEKFLGMIDLIDSYAEIPEYALPKLAYKKVITHDKYVDKLVFEKRKIDIHATGNGANLLQVFFVCESNAPIQLSTYKISSLKNVLNFFKIEIEKMSTDRVQIRLPIKKNYYYKILGITTLNKIEEALQVSDKVDDSEKIKVLEFIELNPDLNNISVGIDKLNRIYLTPDMLDILDAVSSFSTGNVVTKPEAIDSISYVKATNLRIKRLPQYLEKLPLGNLYKSVLLDAVNHDVNYTLLLSNLYDIETYKRINELLKIGMDPLILLNKKISSETLDMYKEVLEKGLSLDFFLQFGDDIKKINYVMNNLESGLNEERMQFLQNGFNQEQTNAIKWIKSFQGDYNLIKKSDTSIELYLKKQLAKKGGKSSILDELLNSDKKTDVYSEVRFIDLKKETLQEISAHLFTDYTFAIDGIFWEDIHQYVLTKSLDLCCDIDKGVSIRVRDGLFLRFDYNTVTFYYFSEVVLKLVFVNGKVLFDDTVHLSQYLPI